MIVVKALIRGSRARIRDSDASTMRVALIRPAAKAAAISPADIQAKSNSLVSSTKYRPRFGLVGERECVDERRMFEKKLQIEDDRRVPGRLDRKVEHLDPDCGKNRQIIGFLTARRLCRRLR